MEGDHKRRPQEKVPRPCDQLGKPIRVASREGKAPKREKEKRDEDKKKDQPGKSPQHDGLFFPSGGHL